MVHLDSTPNARVGVHDSLPPDEVLREGMAEGRRGHAQQQTLGLVRCLVVWLSHAVPNLAEGGQGAGMEFKQSKEVNGGNGG